MSSNGKLPTGWRATSQSGRRSYWRRRSHWKTRAIVWQLLLTVVLLIWLVVEMVAKRQRVRGLSLQSRKILAIILIQTPMIQNHMQGPVQDLGLTSYLRLSCYHWGYGPISMWNSENCQCFHIKSVGCSFYFSIISMLLISVSFLGIIGATKIREKPLFHIKCGVLECWSSRARCWHSVTL